MDNKIYIGSLSSPTYYFENNELNSVNVDMNVGLVGQNLSIDSLTAEVLVDSTELHDVSGYQSSDGQSIMDSLGQTIVTGMSEAVNPSAIISLAYGTPVWYYQDNTLIGKFYVDSVERTGRIRYKLNCVSAIGLLDAAEHGGKLFLSSTFGTVLRHILARGIHGQGSSLINYSMDPDLEDLPVTGWLPHDTKRNNLYRLLFAYGVNVVRGGDGDPMFTFIYPASSTPVIDIESIYDEGSVSYEGAYENVVVLEHTYTPILTEDPVTLFDNTGGTSLVNKEIWFDTAPIIPTSLAAEGSLTFTGVTENSAIVSGSGKLTGIPYVHATRSASMGNPQASVERTIQVNDATMVTTINSQNLLNRLYSYYCPTGRLEKIHNGILWNGEGCGHAYTFTDPYRASATAFLEHMSINASAVNKATCDWRAGYTPAGQSGLYQGFVIITPTWDEVNREWIYDGTWTAPEGIVDMKVILISGGDGGGSGWPGFNGKIAHAYTDVKPTSDLSSIWYGGEGGAGGDGGDGGNPARVKIFTVSGVTPGAEYDYSLGEGGEGGAATGFRPDTPSELRARLSIENPTGQYTDAQINALIAAEGSDWEGEPNAGEEGGDTTFSDGTDTWSTEDEDASVPTGGVYEPFTGAYFALPGGKGLRGGAGGARKIESNGTFTWVTDGEDVTGPDGTVWHGGTTGGTVTSVPGLPEAKIMAYGGNGAGAAVGIDRVLQYHINGETDQYVWWEVTTLGS